MLHITNGDRAGDLIRSSGLPGDVLPWRDVLHEGPVRRASTLEEQSEGRIAFLAEMGWGELSEFGREVQAGKADLAALPE